MYSYFRLCYYLRCRFDRWTACRTFELKYKKSMLLGAPARPRDQDTRSMDTSLIFPSEIRKKLCETNFFSYPKTTSASSAVGKECKAARFCKAFETTPVFLIMLSKIPTGTHKCSRRVRISEMNIF